ncbi:glycosyltransferase family 4 protein [Rhodanobacter lindaniclasticus]|jgi:glycosyltransferase involved in cell wall biosynthesis|uniref:Group 1 glycosyl transferase n=1 Tax=Rhodanobacter lindaniclasticus TaxID=75310 RepID=A0A4S3KIR6_9GAMM|nr:glycosyltransferase family 4 protein [Rhodanobacter lindaniclasticus]THD08642.1 group 1 glycosyl transferase [Rhodanobacter lindaniclasticus]
MRVFLVSTMYPRDAAGWRGVFIRNMVFALARAPSIELNVWAPPGELPERAVKSTTPAEARWLGKLVDLGGISHMMRSGGIRALFAPIKLLTLLAKAYRRHPETDIYHVNWLQSALPLPRDGKPALITVLGNDLKLLRLPLMRPLLRSMMRGRKIAICPNAEWMCDSLQHAFGDIAEIRPVSFGIDPVWYAINRIWAAGEPHRWIVVARLTADKLGPLFDWSSRLFKDGSRELHLFGPMEQEIDVPDWVHYHGPVAPEQLANEWFPRACGLLTLSRHAEGRPQVMLEAMAAGLPIIASRMPAHATVVIDGETGLLCDSRETYGEALNMLEDKATNRRFGETARRRVAEDLGTWDDCANRYRLIYMDLLDDNRDD